MGNVAKLTETALAALRDMYGVIPEQERDGQDGNYRAVAQALYALDNLNDRLRHIQAITEHAAKAIEASAVAAAQAASE